MVGDKKYDAEKVIDGLFESILKLKSLDQTRLTSSPDHASLMEDYENVKYICSNKSGIPTISLVKSTAILKKIKSSVMDLFSITSSHYINAGTAGLIHFNVLLNAFIADINNTTIEELNTVYALFLHKGHKKDKTLDSSYRTISTCPLVAKGLDMYVRDLSLDKWNSIQASTQYQGEGSSHELAAIAVTEAIQHSRYSLAQPIFLLLVDAKSAFDGVVIPYLIRNFYLSGMEGDSVLYFDNRLSSRITYCEFDKTLAGPIHDEQGLEQGGVSSSDLYKIYNNELLAVAQKSELGVHMGGSLTLSAIGQADDTVLMSNDLTKLFLLFKLAQEYCEKFNVQLSPSKTKLLVISPPRKDTVVSFNPLYIDQKQIEFVEEAEHVGVLRASSGNLPNILQRIASFKSALGKVISCGLSRGHRSNPAASISILSIYGTPVLMSGLGSLVLSENEIGIIDQQYKRTIQGLLKIPVNSSPPTVYYIAGTLPATAILHLRLLSNFGMICRLPQDPLHQHARQVFLTSTFSPRSWFTKIRDLLNQYQLPHPLVLLQHPPSKESFKKQAKSKVLEYWHAKLRGEASFLLSVPYFHPQFMSLCSPHRLLTTAGSNPYEVAKARVQLQLLISQYRSAKQTRHWSFTNPQGLCTYPQCNANSSIESTDHILLHCPAYASTRHSLIQLSTTLRCPVSKSLVTSCLLSHSLKKIMQLLLDCSALPEVIAAAQLHGDEVYDDLFYFGRTWCFTVHRERKKRLCQWNFR